MNAINTSGNFESSTIQSFHAVKTDVEDFRRSMNEWVIFLDGRLRNLKMQVMALERRISELEAHRDIEFK